MVKIHCLPGWRSGQSQQTVNLSPIGLRRFESCSRHMKVFLWIWKIIKLFFAALITPAVLAVVVAVWGYWFTAQSQLNLEREKNKAAAYSGFLSQLETSLKTNTEYDAQSQKTRNDEARKLNAEFAVLETNAPDCVIKSIYEKVFNNGSSVVGNLDIIKMIQLILHDDLYGRSCISTSTIEISTSSFMSFYLE